MKFAIDIGHNAPPKDIGAMGIKFEDELTVGVGRELIKILVRNKHTVVETKPSLGQSVVSSLRDRVQTANRENCDIFVSLHFNAANYRAHGTEIYALSRAASGIATEVLKEIVKLGFADRGVKRAPFYVLRHTTMPAVLIECCFCDSARDMQLFDAGKMARAIATGLIGDVGGVSFEYRTVQINTFTWLKTRSAQSVDLSESEKKLLPPGKYQAVVTSEEEGHYYCNFIDGREGFLYAGHVKIS